MKVSEVFLTMRCMGWGIMRICYLFSIARSMMGGLMIPERDQGGTAVDSKGVLLLPNTFLARIAGIGCRHRCNDSEGMLL